MDPNIDNQSVSVVMLVPYSVSPHREQEKESRARLHTTDIPTQAAKATRKFIWFDMLLNE